ncbi:ATP-binding protein [Pseudoalteromonas tunicata]|uniref:sensor histidine kinase n=1 Tax=Pseudoalteromonas tunicata TaxID=314281 RepID=UPI00273FB1F0|nr:ATP-binding protein [Pseudoalteromonas tunicata]MDP5215149.1 ATP-binding protein [Pseudoalteromonas tunicata]
MPDAKQSETLVNTVESQLDHERRLRLQCEKQLLKSQAALTHVEQKLTNQTASVESRQNQLEFLTFLATVTFSQTSLESIIESFLVRTTSFFSTCCVYMKCDLAGNIAIPLHKKMHDSEIKLPELMSSINAKQLILQINDAEFETVLMGAESFFTSNNQFEYVVVLPLFKNKQYHLLAIFFENDKQLDSSKLQTLESGRNLVKIALGRKLAELKLDKKYKELNKAYHSLAQTQQQLTQAEKMASIGQLAAGVAHEINNPIGYVMSNITSLQEYISELSEVFLSVDLGDAERGDEVTFLLQDSKAIIESCMGGLERVRVIVKDLKTFSHSGQEKSVKFNVNSCVDAVLSILGSEFKYGKYEVKLVLFEPIPDVFGTKNQIEQVILNIVMNAKQAMPDGGLIQIQSYLKDERVCLAIEDQGCGMDSQVRQRLFDPFFTTKPVGVGTGLGLSISFKIIEAHHGSIDVRSEIGKGSCFTIKLPIPSHQEV